MRPVLFDYAAIHNKLWPFDHATVYDAPEEPGVYALWRYGHVIFYGRAAGGEQSVRVCLAEHLGGLAGRSTRSASHCSWELCANPGARLVELLARHSARFGAFPVYNRDLEAA